jgi:hypothetical protein
MPVRPGYPSYGGPWGMPYDYSRAPMGAVVGVGPCAPQMTREQELDFLRNQAEAIKEDLDQIDARIKELETE